MSKKRHKIKEQELNGFKYFKAISKMLEQLHEAGCQRDRAHNRILHMDQYISLLLLYMFNPICSSLRSVQQASDLKKVQRKLGVQRSSLGSLSEAAHVFDSYLMAEVVKQLLGKVKHIPHDAKLDDLGRILTVADGTWLKGLPRVTSALWNNDEHKGLKANMQFEVLKGVPVSATLSDANASEKAVLLRNLQPGRLYVLDRGYAKYGLLQQIIDVKSSFVCRLYHNAVFEVTEETELSKDVLDAGIVRDVIVRLGGNGVKDKPQQVLRIVEFEYEPSSKRKYIKPNGAKPTILVVTDMLALDADIVALIYQHRWLIEIFFRFFKHVLGCHHLLSYCDNGIELQMYTAIIACLLIALWTGRKPILRTYEMICWYFVGMADEDELTAHIERLKKQTAA